MRDGVQLATHVYRLVDSAQALVLMAPTAYNEEKAVCGIAFKILQAIKAGYTVVTQYVRGRYTSKGKFNPHFQETQDGVDAFAWAAAQQWSTGILGTFAGSYLGSTQWLSARERHPTVRAMAP